MSATVRARRILGAVMIGLLMIAANAAAQAPKDDERTPFTVSGYFGMAIDNFAPNAVGGYTDVEPGGRKAQFAGGADFEFRVAGTSKSKRQLWLFGETVHGVRSADVDCKAEDKPPVCGQLAAVDPRAALQFVIDHATSLEAFAGARYEFMTLQAGEDTPAKLYLVARLGVQMLSGDATVKTLNLQVNRAYEAFHFGTGLLMPKGLFEGSYIEVGWGRTDLFSHDALSPWRRVKVDAYLSIPLTRDKENKRIPHAFMQLYSDFDPTHRTSDSIQTFYGLEFDLVGMFAKKP